MVLVPSSHFHFQWHPGDTDHVGWNKHPFGFLKGLCQLPPLSCTDMETHSPFAARLQPNMWTRWSLMSGKLSFLSLLITEKPTVCPSTKVLESKRDQLKTNFLVKEGYSESNRENTKTTNQPNKNKTPHYTEKSVSGRNDQRCNRILLVLSQRTIRSLGAFS